MYNLFRGGVFMPKSDDEDSVDKTELETDSDEEITVESLSLLLQESLDINRRNKAHISELKDRLDDLEDDNDLLERKIGRRNRTIDRLSDKVDSLIDEGKKKKKALRNVQKKNRILEELFGFNPRPRSESVVSVKSKFYAPLSDELLKRPAWNGDTKIPKERSPLSKPVRPRSH